MSLQALREAVCAVNRALPTAGLVTMHSGNATRNTSRPRRVSRSPAVVDVAARRAGRRTAVRVLAKPGAIAMVLI